MIRRGSFIVFEGCDRAGKTTQCKKLLEVLKLRGMKAEYMNFPDRSTAVGSIINDYLSKRLDFSDEAIHLLFSANRWELAPIIKQKLESGVSLIVDRYSYSGVAFSAAKEGMDIKWCWNPEIGLPEPDAVFYLTLSEDAASKRGGFGNERYELSSFQRKVQSNYLRLKDSLWQVIDADKDVESLHHEILDRFLAVHKATADNPLRSLEELSVNLD